MNNNSTSSWFFASSRRKISGPGWMVFGFSKSVLKKHQAKIWIHSWISVSQPTFNTIYISYMRSELFATYLLRNFDFGVILGRVPLLFEVMSASATIQETAQLGANHINLKWWIWWILDTATWMIWALDDTNSRTGMNRHATYIVDAIWWWYPHVPINFGKQIFRQRKYCQGKDPFPKRKSSNAWQMPWGFSSLVGDNRPPDHRATRTSAVPLDICSVNATKRSIIACLENNTIQGSIQIFTFYQAV